MKRQISIVAGILIILGGFFGSRMIIDSKKDEKPPVQKNVTTVFTQKVKGSNIGVSVIENGRLIAKRKADLYAEVQGVMESSKKAFKAGIKYSEGETLVNIRSNDAYVSLLAQKSVLQNLVTSILPDLRLDYPEAYKKWNAYVSNFDISAPIAKLPETTSEKEKYFITGKNIYTTYYNTKNLEILQGKYKIRAPYSGVLTETLVNPGTVIRPGQKLGEFIDPSLYELEVAVSQSVLPSLSIGKKVKVNNPNVNNQNWTGQVSRINGKVDATTQTVQVYIDVSGKELKEGVYLEAEISGEEIQDAVEIDRKLLVEGDKIYAIQNNQLYLIPVVIVHKTNKSVIVNNLKDGTEILSRIVPGAFEGMEVKVYSEN
ncbi:RND family efflux transporter, MFP subunit [Reichenbachiella faecimaris]|uniref:RND family efflux transporter, MFP subunit n=1 Tax=Reichenbachiella faecimaris TaxID=692418 RepID=A0A1W2G7N0_REIFA|nr:HlyD family efflux transporter periplasmic adaptor subunit [Reichenbachiella faecimaris]SMD32643.1 RND family efflux transporter, MFP subunit [Reichenbachiella faecimaris]